MPFHVIDCDTCRICSLECCCKHADCSWRGFCISEVSKLPDDLCVTSRKLSETQASFLVRSSLSESVPNDRPKPSHPLSHITAKQSQARNTVEKD
jgi:hypothetical protein